MTFDEAVAAIGCRPVEIGGAVEPRAVGPHDLECLAEHVGERRLSGQAIVEARQLGLGEGRRILLRHGGAGSSPQHPAGREPDAKDGGGEEQGSGVTRENRRHRCFLQGDGAMAVF